MRAARTRRVLLALAVLAVGVGGTGATVLAPPAAAAGPTTVTGPWTLAPGQTLTAAGGHWSIVMQPDGNLVERLGSGPGSVAIWSTKTYGHPGSRLDLAADGRLQIVDGDEVVWWQSPGPAAASTPGRLQLRDDGRLVTTTANGTALWANLTFGSTLTGGSALLGPGQKLTSPLGLKGYSANHTLEMQADGNLVQYVNGTRFGRKPLWSSGTAGHPGAYARLTPAGHLQVFGPTGTALYTSSNPSAPADQRPARLVMPDDSRLQVQTAKGWPLWTTVRFGTSLRSGSVLYPGQRFASADGTLTAGMSTNGALMVWDSADRQVWNMSSSRWMGATAQMQGDGNLVVRDRAGSAVWSSGTSGSGAVAAFSSTGSLNVVRGGTVLKTVYRGLRDSIVAVAMSQVGYTVEGYCNKYSAYWGTGTPCPGGRSQAWCADFAAWAWATGGVKGLPYPSQLNGFPISWRTWAKPRGRWIAAGSGYRARAGDAVVYGLDVPGKLGHVAIATGGYTNGYPDTVNGDFGGFTTRVAFVKGLRISDHDDPRTVIAGYISPV